MREQLEATRGYVYWSDLRAHAQRDVIIVVADELDLLDVGEAVAKNDTARVQRWIEEKKLSKPTSEDLARWPNEPAARFESLIVAPFVLVRPPRPGPLN